MTSSSPPPAELCVSYNRRSSTGASRGGSPPTDEQQQLDRRHRATPAPPACGSVRATTTYPCQDRSRAGFRPPRKTCNSLKPHLGACRLPASGRADPEVSSAPGALPDPRIFDRLARRVRHRPATALRRRSTESGSPVLVAARARGRRKMSSRTPKWETELLSRRLSRRHPNFHG